MRFVAGIDGGGTRTTLLWRQEGQEREHTVLFGPFNYNSIGPDAFEARVRDIAESLNRIGECVSLVIGAAGVSNPALRNSLFHIMEEHGIKNVQLVGDHRIALEGAFAGLDGIALIAGTGSICFGKSGDRIERTGGWGHLIGDRGSAYAIAQAMFCHVVCVYDGYGEPSLLTELLAERGLDTRESIIKYIYSCDKSAIAKLAPLVDLAAREGDKVALEIIDRESEQLFRLVEGVARKLSVSGGPVAFFGGVLSCDSMMKRALVQRMETDGRFKPSRPVLSAAEGALSLASKRV